MKKYLSISTITVVALLVSLFVANVGLAANEIDTVVEVKGVLVNIANVMRDVLFVVAVIFIIVAAYKYLFSGGNEEDVKTAHSMLAYAAVAVLVAILASAFVAIISDVIFRGSSSSSAGSSAVSGGSYEGYGTDPEGFYINR